MAVRHGVKKIQYRPGVIEGFCQHRLKIGSGPHFVMITDPVQLTRSTRLRSRRKPARP